MTTPEQDRMQANYLADYRRAHAAALTWVKAHQGQAITFRDYGRAGFLCSLDAIADQWADGDTDSRALLQAMIDATEGRCTFFQAKAVLSQVLLELGSSNGGSA